MFVGRRGVVVLEIERVAGGVFLLVLGSRVVRLYMLWRRRKPVVA